MKKRNKDNYTNNVNNSVNNSNNNDNLSPEYVASAPLPSLCPCEVSCVIGGCAFPPPHTV